MIITVEDKVDPILKKVRDVACTGEKEDRKILISNVAEVMNICSLVIKFYNIKFNHAIQKDND